MAGFPLCILLLAAAAVGAAAHGGKLHKTTPETSNYIRTKVASCRDWVPATGKMGKVQLLVSPGAKASGGADVKVGASSRLRTCLLTGWLQHKPGL